jgi:hypothetical protein
MDQYFFCYNKKVSDYLTMKGVKPITIAKEMRENRIFSLYKQTPELQKALQEYKLNK